MKDPKAIHTALVEAARESRTGWVSAGEISWRLRIAGGDGRGVMNSLRGLVAVGVVERRRRARTHNSEYRPAAMTEVA